MTNLHLARWATELKGTGVPALPFVSENLLASVPCIAITGGPCSGKSSIMQILKSEFTDIHFVHEVASIIIGRVGILPSKNPVQNRSFQKAKYKVGKIFRTTSVEFAIVQKKQAVVLDRGEADGAAYFEGGIKEFEAVLGTSITSEYAHIDMVICLDVPPQDVYEQNKANNPSRFENYDEAVNLGRRTKNAWERHPNFKFVSSETNWETKVNTVRELIRSVLH